MLSWACHLQKALSISEAEIFWFPFLGAKDSSSLRMCSLKTESRIRFPRLASKYIFDTWQKNKQFPILHQSLELFHSKKAFQKLVIGRKILNKGKGSFGQAFRPSILSSILNKNLFLWKINKFYFKFEQYIFVQYWAQYWGMCEPALRIRSLENSFGDQGEDSLVMYINLVWF